MNGLRRQVASKRWTLLLVLAGCLLGSVAGQALRPHAARAQVPDSGAQRNQMLTELKAINRKRGDIESLLKSGKVTVRVAKERAKSDSGSGK